MGLDAAKNQLERSHAMRSNYQYWKLTEEKLLINNFQKMTGRELATLLNRSTQSIRARAFSLRLKKKSTNSERNSYQYWSNEEVNFILENYNKMTNEELATKLNRSYNSINTRASMMGLKKDKSFFRRHAVKTNP